MPVKLGGLGVRSVEKLASSFYIESPPMPTEGPPLNTERPPTAIEGPPLPTEGLSAPIAIK